MIERRLETPDPRDEPAYAVTEAARYLRLSPATLRSWTVGREYPTAGGPRKFAPLIRLAEDKPPTLSFANLIEAHVLRSLRTEHGVPLEAVRKALHYAEKQLGIQRLLAREELRTSGGEVFLDRYGQLINLSASGQLAIRKIFEAHLVRVEWRDLHPIRLYPFVVIDGTSDDRAIVIDPYVSFGRPVVRAGFVSTRIIAERIDAGESLNTLALDYGLRPGDIEQAVLYERAA